MESFVSWNLFEYDQIMKIKVYCAYIDCDRQVQLSENMHVITGPIKFVNSLLECLQLKLCYANDVWMLFALFANGAVEKIHSNKFSVPFPETDIYLNHSVVFDNILKIENVECGICMLTSTGQILLNSDVLLENSYIVDIKGFDKTIVVFYLNKSIKIYSIMKEASHYDISHVKIYDELLECHKANIKNIHYSTDNLILVLYDNKFICSKDFTEIKKTNYYTIIRCVSNIFYRYYVITWEMIYNIVNAPIKGSFVLENTVENVTTEACFDINAYHDMSNPKANFYKKIEYKYSYKVGWMVTVIMLDDIIRTFIDEFGKEPIELFDIFDEYKKVYNNSIGNYI